LGEPWEYFYEHGIRNHIARHAAADDPKKKKSHSLPDHLGNGWFGGFLPPTAFAIVAATGDIFAGLWYPIVVALMTFVIGLIFLPETRTRDIYAGD